MKVLYVTGSCLTKNTSANMSHNGFVKGLIDCGCDVDILMAKESWGQEDKGMPHWENADYYEFESVSMPERLKNTIKKHEADIIQSARSISDTSDEESSANTKLIFRQIAKKIYYQIFRPDPLYPLEKKWLKNAQHFKKRESYDLVISNSSPAASHNLVILLHKKHRISFNRWVQIWEDPWYFDLYGGHLPEVKKEEHRLLLAASEVYYVSPLTLMYQKEYFPDCAKKMDCIPLPFLEFEQENNANRNVICGSFGYFGDYYSVTRDLRPFYDALVDMECVGFIFGDTDLVLPSTDKISVSGRVTLDVLAEIQARTDILVHLCNLHGGQIPGKIYHYSSTDKPILFILDGTQEEKDVIFRFFSKFQRYYFCENTKESIKETIQQILKRDREPETKVIDFEPKHVVDQIIRKKMLGSK